VGKRGEIKKKKKKQTRHLEKQTKTTNEILRQKKKKTTDKVLRKKTKKANEILRKRNEARQLAGGWPVRSLCEMVGAGLWERGELRVMWRASTRVRAS
jgi:hypothetical protein